jgi:hypothetical protein
VNFRHVDAVGVQCVQHQGISLFEQGDEQVFRPYVIVAMVAAFLFGYAENSPRGRVKL